jgi:hypothetical protein
MYESVSGAYVADTASLFNYVQLITGYNEIEAVAYP